ncbi:hypothetical protein SERLA73DRAFT_74489 [Serpula lacrymans var. lacrymans S7.3]|uniref:Protein kinase C-terminal domain-containing protein n=2 Tax=Serpula lacrymans var. lacrymans TaxID=341189 RepID=F8PZE5_SERL3|nr:uncharacterized protein SERLADRAFT_439141 [Serpula lacrymans var. lacrymans S7.9]EGN98267.1 hypothetical protein SERLA73DRAFT_74489 [Serpula lacrymans var. lacrymans S7.3]EGO23839.1 hypothetical protein SERLADRAFT_439141 [Serpula lacrymans var. lacrymans S7.9]
MYQKILQDPLVFGSEIGSEARSILTGLLTRDPARRLGVNGAEEIRRHPFFEKHIDLEVATEKDPAALQAQCDMSNFDTVFTAEEAIDSYVDGSHLSQIVQDQFAGFSYDGSHMPISA